MAEFRLTRWLWCVLLLGSPVLALAEDDNAGEAGSISSLKGAVSVERDGELLDAEAGMRLLVGDVIHTGKEASVGVVLRDDTTLSLGENSQLSMKQFDFEPAKGVLGMTLEMIKGTLACITGRIAELAPESMKVETPVGMLGVRGTKFLVEVRE